VTDFGGQEDRRLREALLLQQAKRCVADRRDAQA